MGVMISRTQYELAINLTGDGGGETSYVTGDRTASITVTATVGLKHTAASALSKLVDGGLGHNDTDSTYFAFVDVSAHWLKFDFGTAKVVDEAKWYQDTTDGHGTWRWYGSNDDSSYTAIGSNFSLGGSMMQTQTELNGNSTSYRYYRLTGVSGTASQGPWLKEIEFKQN